MDLTALTGKGRSIPFRISCVDLEARAQMALKQLADCRLCPHSCGSNRLRSRGAFCRSGEKVKVYSFFPHHGEEPVLSGGKGSGTIFLGHCTMKCVYCQNHRFSQLDEGQELSVEQLSNIMLSLTKDKVHNLNLVTPAHYVPQILSALCLARSVGFNLPIIYNTSGYESLETLRLLDGVVDVYLADMRYSNNGAAMRYSRASNYVEINRTAIREMHRQVGTLQVVNGLAIMGLIVRHMVLPENIADTEAVFKFIAEEISTETFVSLMSQYHPGYKTAAYPEINRKISISEYAAARKLLTKYALINGWCQAWPRPLDSSIMLGANFEPRFLE